MVERERKRKAVILDIDGVVNWRFPAQQAGIPLLGHHNPDKYTRSIKEVPIAFGPSRDLSNIVSCYSAARHFITPVFPDVTRVIKGLDREETVIFGNTGRPNESLMVAATWGSLRIAGIADRFALIYFKPKGQKTVEHKFAVSAKKAEEYGEENITVVDDNPYDLFPQAKRLRRGKFVLIEDLTTDRLTKGIDMASEYPNVIVAKTLRQGLAAKILFP
ncbi:MAG: hypothetical protein Q7R82_00775 [Candidatus Daviesbacteria bacterium]|nr:hypothetical protein [Candidatus Daviesbacteria bacterium]